MSDGINSIDDLKVVITAETEKMSQGLANAQTLINSFSASGSGSLSILDSGFEKAGAAVEAFKGKLGVWLVLAEQVAGIAGKLASEGEKLGKALGEEERVNALKAAVVDLGSAVSEGVTGAFKNATGAMSLWALGLTAAGDASVTTNDRIKTSFAELADTAERALAYAAQGFRTLGGAEAGDDLAKLGKHIEHLKQHMQETKRIRDEVNSQKDGGFFDFLSVNQVERYNAMLAEMGKRLEDLISKRDEAMQASRAGWGNVEVSNEFSEKAIQSLEREARGLRQAAEARAMAAGAAAEYTARMKALNSIDDSNATPMASDRARINDIASDIGRLKAEEADAKAAEREKVDAERAERRAEEAVKRIQAEILAIEGKTRALLDGSPATAAAIEQEKVLNDLRSKGISETSAQAIQAVALAAQRTEAAKHFDELRAQLASLKGYGDAVGRSLETAFKSWTNGAKVDGKEMVRSLIADLAMLSFRQSVSQPIGGGITSLLGSVLTGAFGGARADGGPVEAGSTYLVGEQGPELFTAKNSGTIIANDKLRGAGGGSSGAVYVTIHQPINAQGAYPESIEQIKQAIAEQNSRLPGRVMEVVTDARERGGM